MSTGGWIDPDTQKEDRKVMSYSDGDMYHLVMSDEFNRAGRKFKDGDDPMWTAIDKSDDDVASSGAKSIHFYNSSQITTKNGFLVITTSNEDTKWKAYNTYKQKYEIMSRHFKSGMLQSWNKFCFTGGILEIDLQFPGEHDVGGLWPAVWLLGNLARATFLSSTNLMWPWSYAECNRDLQKAQEISGCDLTQHYSLRSKLGRGSTEIDIVEVMSGPSATLPAIVKNNVTLPYASMTLQVAPGIPATTRPRRPVPGKTPEMGFTWYKNLSYGVNSSANPFFYGTYLGPTKTNEPIGRSSKQAYQCDAISTMGAIDADYFNSTKKFRLEWQPGDNGYLHWYYDGKFRFGIEAEGLKRYKTKIPDEPSYVIINTAISTTWGFPKPSEGCGSYDCKISKCNFNSGFCESLPAKFYIDSIRIFQKKSDLSQTIGCNPKDRPTTRFIKAHDYRYCAVNQPRSLKSNIVTGGAVCTTNKNCGDHGYCLFMRCRCHSEWQGPNCLVYKYKNDFPDWEQEVWHVKIPHISLFLLLLVILFTFSFLVIIIVIVVKKKQKSEEEVSAAWL